MKRTRKNILLIIFVIFMTASISLTVVNMNNNVFVSTFDEENKGDIKSKINEVIKYHVENKLFSGTVLVAEGNNVLFNEGYGYAKRYSGRSENMPYTKYLLGSITKTFTAWAIMQLEERKLLSRNDKVTTYFPEYKEWKDITIHQLLNHSSGIPNYYQSPTDYIRYFSTHRTPEQIISRYQYTPLLFKPGTDFKYSNTGYIVLARIIEKVSGVTYIDYLSKNVLKPLGLTNTGYNENTYSVENLAKGYCFNMIVEVNGFNLSNLYGAGGLYSSTEDLFKFCKAMDEQKLYNDTLKVKTKSGYYGYGLSFEDWDIYGKVFYHTGGGPGISTGMYKLVDRNVIIVILSNNQLYPTEELVTDLSSCILSF